MVSTELCVCMQYTEQNSHSRPKSSSSCEYEREMRGRGSNTAMKTTLWYWLADVVHPSHQGFDVKKKGTFMCVGAALVFFLVTCRYGRCGLGSAAGRERGEGGRAQAAVSEIISTGAFVCWLPPFCLVYKKQLEAGWELRPCPHWYLAKRTFSCTFGPLVHPQKAFYLTKNGYFSKHLLKWLFLKTLVAVILCDTECFGLQKRHTSIGPSPLLFSTMSLPEKQQQELRTFALFQHCLSTQSPQSHLLLLVSP